MTRFQTQPRLYTIGHSSLTLERFLARLAEQDIKTLVDVRSVPRSHHVPQFNKTRLRQALSEAGIDYLYMGDRLGGKPQDPSVYRSGQVPQRWADVTREIDYQAVMAKGWYREALGELEALARTSRTVVMCAEEDPQHCHRKHLITASLPEEIDVLHMRADGSLDQEEKGK